MRHRLRKHARRCAAFTLIEVLAALLVLGLALTAWQLRIAQNLDSASYLRDKTVGTWVALNQLELLRVAQRRGSVAPISGLQGSVTMAGETWYWVMTPQVTDGLDEPDAVVPLTVGVSKNSAEAARDAPVVTLTGVSNAWR